MIRGKATVAAASAVALLWMLVLGRTNEGVLPATKAAAVPSFRELTGRIVNGETNAPNPARDTVVLTVRASRAAAYATRDERIDSSLRKALEAVAAQRMEAGASTPPAQLRVELLDTFVAWPRTNSTYGVDDDGTVVDVDRGVRLTTPEKWRRELSAARERLRARHYGALLPWSDASVAVPRMASFVVIDVETGLAFRAQRRAGSSHADVQPLTSQDSAIMNQIYGGEWSWDRRAVLLVYNDKQYAASMNGKPHGGDGIPGNGFNGHFCIHFAGSTTHGKANLDLAHQTMVQKAAGQLPSFLQNLTPHQVAGLFIVAYNQHDEQLLNAVAVDGNGKLLSEPFRNSRILKIRRGDPRPMASSIKSEQLQSELAYDMEVTLYSEGSAKGQSRTISFQLVHIPSVSGWFIRSISW